jgi:cobalamin biosynthesis Mg chelatase CobN
MRKLLLALAIALTAALPVTAALADPPTDPAPGADCSHGINDDGTCRPDPNENGQDCEAHGTTNPAGNDGNEDHCLTTTTATTTTTPPTTTTTVTTPTQTTTTTEPPTTTTTQTESTSSTTATQPPTTTVAATTTAQPPTNGGPGNDGPSDPGKKDASQPVRLAFTGAEDIVPWALVALALAVLGSFLFWIGNRKTTEE